MNDCLIGCITSDDEGRGYYCEECPELSAHLTAVTHRYTSRTDEAIK